MSDVRTHIPFEVEYHRDYGIFEHETVDGTPVKIVSSRSWEEFSVQVRTVSENIDGYIISPELMTSPVELDHVPKMKDTIRDRLVDIRNFSRRSPWARFVIGSALFEGDTIYNGAQAFQHSQDVGRQYKRYFVGSEEQAVFATAGEEPGEVFVDPDHGLLLCSDIILAAGASITNRLQGTHGSYSERMKSIIDPQVRSLFVSACWGVPYEYHDDDKMTPEHRYQDMLERCVSQILDSYINVDEVIVADRAVEATGVAPFNAHFVRV